MSLQTFSNSLFDLYAAAEKASPDRFPTEMVRIISRVVEFDGAVLGSGGADALLTRDDRGWNLLADEPEKPDHAARAFVRKVTQPATGKSFFEEQHLKELPSFTSERNLRKLLLGGDAAIGSGNGRWLMLYRGAEDGFNESETSVLHALWQHARHTIDMNLHRALGNLDPDPATRAQALVDSRGIIEIANPAMIDLLKLEWPSFNARSLPLPVVAELVNTGRYRGRRIEISASQKFGYMACTAERVHVIDCLSPSELNVADQFAQGLTHSQIAARLKVSPHTVRNQLAQVYLKLGVHSKVELVRMFAGRRVDTLRQTS